jgi:hypothetical protein
MYFKTRRACNELPTGLVGRRLLSRFNHNNNILKIRRKLAAVVPTMTITRTGPVYVLSAGLNIPAIKILNPKKLFFIQIFNITTQ